MDTIKTLLKQPFYVIALIVGALLVAFPSITIDKDNHLLPHQPTTILPVIVGISLLVLASAAFAFTLLPKREIAADGLDLSRVKEADGGFSTSVSGCEIRVVLGRLEELPLAGGVVVVLPCNEYFDDQCVADTRSALGAYVHRVFDGQAADFTLLMKGDCAKRFGEGVEQQRTNNDRARSFGAGQCLLLTRPLNRSVPVALVSTSTQRAGLGLASRISYLFDGMRELVTRLADARFNEVVMPVLGSGHGGIAPPLAFVGLVLAVAEAARYGPGGQCLKRVTIVVYKRDSNTPSAIDPTIIRRALALVASGG